MVGWMFGDGVGGTLSASVESGCVTARKVVSWVMVWLWENSGQ